MEQATGVKVKGYVDFLNILLTAKDDSEAGLTQEEIRRFSLQVRAVILSLKRWLINIGKWVCCF